MNRLPFVERGKAGDMDFSQSSQNQIKIIFVLYLIAVFSIFFLLIVRLFQLTVVKGSYYRRLSENNRIRATIVTNDSTDE
jgi:cell division protein FtsI/penicillin-binding protein 2